MMPCIASQEVIMDLTELYFEIVYPIFPFFHRPSWIHRIARAQYTSDRELYAATMAVCALVGSRVRDGSVTNPKWDVTRLRQSRPERFYAEARKQLASLDTVTSLNVLRARAVLAIAAIQNGDMREMRWQLGTYHTLVAVDGLHDEANWPAGIGVVERQERRRLFWSMYTLDIFTSSVSNRVVVSREEQCNVLYPAEINDELIADGTDLPETVDSFDQLWRKRPSLQVQSECWLSGWNFITDVYRILEHALSKFRNVRLHKQRRRSVLHDIFPDSSSTLTEATVQDTVLQMYKRLPACFREIPEITGDIEKDRVSFQAANILGSVQLLRIVLCVAGDTSIEYRCRVAGDVVDALVQTPVAYSLAISAPLLHHLSGIGVILGSVLEKPLSESDYTKVRSIVLLMGQMLEKMEPIQHAAGASEKLRNMVARIDAYVKPRHPRDDAASAEQQVGSSGPLNGLPIQPGPADSHDAGTGYEAAIGAEVPDDWLIQVPPDLLGDWGWDFDLA
ncbi:hypothetical protein DV735_g2247, partial [Chaetothyriales sp. CBS 134920]